MNHDKIKYLNKQFKNIELDERIEQSHKEETTKMLLIQPFLKILGYNNLDHLIHEHTVEGGSVDIAVRLRKKDPDIFIECKHTDNVLGSKVINQLNRYSQTTNSVKIGVTTNGVKYDFFTRDNKNWTHMRPFFSFNLKDYDDSDLNILCLFCEDEINIPKILLYADEIYFKQRFEDAFLSLIQHPTHEFLKEIYNMMGGKVASEKVKEKISELLNVYALENICEKLHLMNTNTNQYIFTTEKEKAFFNIVQGFLAATTKIKKRNLSRIGYRDMKKQFSIMIDDSQINTICNISEKRHAYNLHIDGENFKIDDINVVCLVKYKDEIINSAMSIFNKLD